MAKTFCRHCTTEGRPACSQWVSCQISLLDLESWSASDIQSPPPPTQILGDQNLKGHSQLLRVSLQWSIKPSNLVFIYPSSCTGPHLDTCPNMVPCVTVMFSLLIRVCGQGSFQITKQYPPAAGLVELGIDLIPGSS